MSGPERLESILDDCLRAMEAGRPLDRRAVLAASPDLAPELEAFFANQDWIRGELHSVREVPEPVPLPIRFGKYEILEELGRGGMGVVYKARNLELKTQIVALKVLHLGQFASADDLARFKAEAEAAAELDHPAIVPVHEFGEEQGQAYYTMRFIEGTTLEEQLDRYRDDPQAAARLMVTVAGAIRFAHRRGIIHRDLKPGNILVDAAGRPHVTDFGLAKRLDAEGAATASGEIIGTLAYLAPEQLSRHRRRLTLSVDLHALGAVLYALLTGRPPFAGETPLEVLEKIELQDPVAPGKLNPKVDADLSAVCLMALRKDPARRYEHGGTFADDLERWLDGRTVLARPIGRVARGINACRRHPARVALGVLGLLALLLLGLWTESVRLRHARQAARREEILEGNVFTARFAAHVILNRMREWGGRVETLSRSPELVRLLTDVQRGLKERPPVKGEDFEKRAEAKALQRFAEGLSKEPMVVNWHLMDVTGLMIARTPAAVIGVDFSERDYFRGTLAHFGQSGLAAVHVSRVYRSQADGLDKFDVCAPVVAEGVLLGVVAVAVTTDPTLGEPHLQSERRKVVLVGPWDPSPPGRMENPPDFVVLVHPAMTPGQEAVRFDPALFPAKFPRSCRQELVSNDERPAAALKRKDYQDPFASRNAAYAGPWLAGFAPVGNTGFVVIVQQQED